MSMENGGKKITKIKLYACGYCKNNLGIVFRGHKKDVRRFPALVVYLHHKKFGNILFDTGYSELVYQNGFVSFIYNCLNKTFVEPQEIIDVRLKNDGISPESVQYIIISHAHPDHIGALKRFSDYRLITTKDVLMKMKAKKTLSLTFRNMIPQGKIRVKIVEPISEKNLFSKFFSEVYDIFGDGSVIGVRLDGHAEGQMGIYLPEYKMFFAADACWGEDILDEVTNMRPLPKLIQDNFRKYSSTVTAVKQFSAENPDIKIIYSHGGMEQKVYE